jgi:hypothetical protein
VVVPHPVDERGDRLELALGRDVPGDLDPPMSRPIRRSGTRHEAGWDIDDPGAADSFVQYLDEWVASRDG